ncbi:MAG: DNA gyrase inhibitor YacG [Planctomycetota bacterium]|nr:DNA gyrase inhibitor YacG [Planctomycetota bacterium]
MEKTNGRKVVVNCPQCGKPLPWDPKNAYRPFCTERCKLIDLGQWASGNYRVPTDADQSPSNDNEA